MKNPLCKIGWHKWKVEGLFMICEWCDEKEVACPGPFVGLGTGICETCGDVGTEDRHKRNY